MYVCHMHAIPMEARRGHWSSWNQRNRWLLTVMWVLRTKSVFSAETVSDYLAISPALGWILVICLVLVFQDKVSLWSPDCPVL